MKKLAGSRYTLLSARRPQRPASEEARLELERRMRALERSEAQEREPSPR